MRSRFARPSQFTRFLDMRHGSLGATTEAAAASGRRVVQPEAPGQKSLVMRRIEIDRFVETVLGTLAVAGRLEIIPIR